MAANGGLPLGLFSSFGFSMGPGAYKIKLTNYNTPMFLFDMGKNGGIAEIRFPARALVITGGLLRLWV